jgi:hypothetical protein
MIRRKKIVLTLALLLAFWLVWSRVRIYLWLHASLWLVVLVLIGLALALYLGVSALLERRRPAPPSGAGDR